MTGFYRTGYCAVGPDDVGVRTAKELFLQRQASVPLWPPLTLGAPGEVAYHRRHGNLDFHRI